jgi:hypothetical protein
VPLELVTSYPCQICNCLRLLLRRQSAVALRVTRVPKEDVGVLRSGGADAEGIGKVGGDVRGVVRGGVAGEKGEHEGKCFFRVCVEEDVRRIGDDVRLYVDGTDEQILPLSGAGSGRIGVVFSLKEERGQLFLASQLKGTKVDAHAGEGQAP